MFENIISLSHFYAWNSVRGTYSPSSVVVPSSLHFFVIVSNTNIFGCEISPISRNVCSSVSQLSKCNKAPSKAQ